MPKVHIRKKKISKGRLSLYLDFSPPLRNPKTGAPKRFEHLDLFIFEKPATPLERRHNSETTALVDNIRAQRQLDIQNRKFGFMSGEEREKSFAEFLGHYLGGIKEGASDNNAMAYRYFVAFAGFDISFLDLDEFFCQDYKNYMLAGPTVNRRGRPISKNTASSYFAKFRNALLRAYKKGLMPVDLYAQIDPIKPHETHREQLELEEFQQLADAACPSAVIKQAAIFAGLTGLRFSDVVTLRWREVRGKAGKYVLQFTQEKTEGAEILPISDQAVELLGERGEPEAKVFQGLYYSALKPCFAVWLKNAGIYKNITFHSFRHTYATLQLELGTELLTVSKMLGHKSIKTTLIYTKVKDKKKIEAASRIQLKL